MASRLSMVFALASAGGHPAFGAVRILVLACALLVVTLLGCERSAEPGPQGARGPGRVVDAMGGDPLAAEIRRIKDLLADDQVADAQAALRHLQRQRAGLSADRQLEVDRLEALLAVEP